MDTFEYLTVKVPRGKKAKAKALDEYGAQGWEIVSIKDIWQGYIPVNMKRVKSATAAPVPKGLMARIFGR